MRPPVARRRPCSVVGAGALAQAPPQPPPPRPAVGPERAVRAAAAGRTHAGQRPEGRRRALRHRPEGVGVRSRSARAWPTIRRARPAWRSSSPTPPRKARATRDSRRLRDEVFAMGASLGAAVGQDSSTFTMRGLAETLPQMLGRAGRRRPPPDLPRGRGAAADRQRRPAGAGAAGLGVVRVEPPVPHRALRRRIPTAGSAPRPSR